MYLEGFKRGRATVKMRRTLSLKVFKETVADNRNAGMNCSRVSRVGIGFLIVKMI